MALFIPEWTRASGRQLQIKRVLNGLDDATSVRKVLREGSAAPELFIEHLERGWLALATVDTPFDALDAGQLFARKPVRLSTPSWPPGAPPARRLAAAGDPVGLQRRRHHAAGAPAGRPARAAPAVTRTFY
ncbi:hypothetical protein G4G28_01250 [Massilia sp. Dwa41.01b]|uniref:hypothetical protein n=1 Tax=Massilia sp. Dwa41.01b TaxID=2709302 RepID=UPI001600817E|nr:hypothetical protein [Massilia sp. Dwa41.01b]QNA87439.1 hypothetical protein G4G28_01250 [Massilia sp. Dwa41.01b]